MLVQILCCVMVNCACMEAAQHGFLNNEVLFRITLRLIPKARINSIFSLHDMEEVLFFASMFTLYHQFSTCFLSIQSLELALLLFHIQTTIKRQQHISLN